MKRLLVVLAIVLAMTACSSGVDQAAYDAVVSENAELKEQIAALEKQMSEKVDNDSEIKKKSLGYTFEAKRDFYWIGKQVDFLHSMLDRTPYDISEDLDSLIESTQFGYDTHLDSLAHATENGAIEDLEAQHDAWVEIIDKACDEINKIYRAVGDELNALQ